MAAARGEEDEAQVREDAAPGELTPAGPEPRPRPQGSSPPPDRSPGRVPRGARPAGEGGRGGRGDDSSRGAAMVAGDGGRRERTRRRRGAREDTVGAATAEAEAQGRWQATAETDGGEETGKEENNGSPVEAREAGPEELFDSQCKMSFLSFCFWEQQTPFGGAFSFWSFLEKQKLPQTGP